MSNIVIEADRIISEGSKEKERQYGPFSEGMKRAAMIASGMTGRTWTAHDMYIAMISLKFSRQSYNFKEDNLLDAAAYIGAWQNLIDETKPIHAGPDAPQDTSTSNKVLLKENQKSDQTICEKVDPRESDDCYAETTQEKTVMPSPLLNSLIGEVK